ncbi:MAG: FeoA family protein [Limnochordia bacterium]
MSKNLPTSLDTLSPGSGGTISTLTCCGPLRRKLMDMGLTPGTQVVVEGVAPLKDPIIVCARGCRLGLRKEEAASIVVTDQSLVYPDRGCGRRHRFRGAHRRGGKWSS